MLPAVVVGTLLFGGVGYGEKMKTSIASALLSTEPLTRQAAFDQVVGERKTTVQELISILGRSNVDRLYQGPLHRAIVLLGELRAKEAVAPLSGLLSYVPQDFETEEQIPTEAYYVATVALVEIGFPAIEAMLAKIRNADDKLERELAAWVIMEIEGKEQALNRIEALTRRAAARTTGRFQGAARYIETYEPTFEPPSPE